MKKPTVSGILKKIRGTSHRVADDLATVKHTLITAEFIEKLSSAGYKVVKDELPVAPSISSTVVDRGFVQITIDSGHPAGAHYPSRYPITVDIVAEEDGIRLHFSGGGTGGCVKVEQEAANNLRIRLDDSISR